MNILSLLKTNCRDRILFIFVGFVFSFLIYGVIFSEPEKDEKSMSEYSDAISGIRYMEDFYKEDPMYYGVYGRVSSNSDRMVRCFINYELGFDRRALYHWNGDVKIDEALKVSGNLMEHHIDRIKEFEGAVKEYFDGVDEKTLILDTDKVDSGLTKKIRNMVESDSVYLYRADITGCVYVIAREE